VDSANKCPTPYPALLNRQILKNLVFVAKDEKRIKTFIPPVVDGVTGGWGGGGGRKN